jgi:hypothetical protein
MYSDEAVGFSRVQLMEQPLVLNDFIRQHRVFSSVTLFVA